MVYSRLFKLLQLALGEEPTEAFLGEFSAMSAEEWANLYKQAVKQTVLGLAFAGISKLPSDMRPPLRLLFQWGGGAETISGSNKLMNAEAARLTRFFESYGHRTVILKGQANARLYPDAFARQPGDIDIWLDGGKKAVVNLVKELNLDHSQLHSDHHVHLKKNANGIAVEIHFLPSSGNLNPFTAKRMLKFLNQELDHNELVEEGFYVPTIKFALVMQLSHIQRHYMGGGIGLRQLVDYYVLLQHSSEEDRNEVSGLLKSFGLRYMAGAVMWLLHEKLGLPKDKLLCEPDAKRGEKILAEAMYSGNFGQHSGKPRRRWLFWWTGRRVDNWKRFLFNPSESVFGEIYYWKTFVKNISARVKLGKISLRDVE